jgi:hypothetical protein
MTLSMMTLSIMGLFATLRIAARNIMTLIIECHYAECRDYLNVMMCVVILNVIMLSAFVLNVIMLSVNMLNVIILNVITLYVIMLSVFVLNVVMLSVVAPILG